MSHTEHFSNQISHNILPPFHVDRPELPSPTCQMFEPNHLNLMGAILSGKATMTPNGFVQDGQVVARLSEALTFGVKRQIRGLDSNAYFGYLLCQKSE